MRFNGFVPHFSLAAGGLAAACLALALLASSVVAAQRFEMTMCEYSVAAATPLQHG